MSDETQEKARAVDLSAPMQQHTVAMALRCPGVMARIRGCMNPDYFDDNALADIVAWTNQHWDENKEVPSKQALRDCFQEHHPLIKSLFAQELPDPKHTVQRITHFARLKAVRLAILRGGEAVSAEMNGEKYLDAKGKPVDLDLVKLFREALNVGTDMSDLGEDLGSTMEGDIAEILNPPKAEKLLTGMGHLDEAGVALERGDLGCVLGASKRGKSHVLINLAYGALKQGLNVVYYTLEMPAKKVRRRFHQRVAGAKADVKGNPEEFVRLLKERYGRLILGRMVVKRWPSRGATVEDIRAHLAQLQARGDRIDLVIVDYAGILKPVKSTGEVRHDLAAIFLELRAIAGEYNVGMWTAAQANRGSVNKELVTMADFAECFEIVQHLDVGFSVCMTEDEKANGEGRFFVLASRNEADGMVITFKHDYSRCMIQTTGVQKPEAEKKRRDRDTSGPAANADAAIAAEKLRKKQKADRDSV